MDASTIGRLRRRLGITQTELAARLGVDQGTVSRWERGNERPRPNALKLLREVLTNDAAWHPYRQAKARIVADIIEAYLFDDALTLSAMSDKAAGHIAVVYGVDAHAWLGSDLVSHLVALGLAPEKSEATVDALLSGTFAGARLSTRLKQQPLRLYIEPVIADGAMAGLFVCVLPSDNELHSPDVEVELVDIEGEVSNLDWPAVGSRAAVRSVIGSAQPVG